MRAHVAIFYPNIYLTILDVSTFREVEQIYQTQRKLNFKNHTQTVSTYRTVSLHFTHLNLNSKT